MSVEWRTAALGRGCVETLRRNRAVKTASRIADIAVEYSADRGLHRHEGQIFLHPIVTIEFSHTLGRFQSFGGAVANGWSGSRPAAHVSPTGTTGQGGERPFICPGLNGEVVSEADICTATKIPIGGDQQRLPYVEAQRLGGLNRRQARRKPRDQLRGA
jgi:hypothetical protein